MISLLPVPGGFITLANRCLSPAVVSSLSPPTFVYPFIFRNSRPKTSTDPGRVSYAAGHTGLPEQSVSPYN